MRPGGRFERGPSTFSGTAVPVLNDVHIEASTSQNKTQGKCLVIMRLTNI